MIVYCVCLLAALITRASVISAYEYAPPPRPCSGGFCGGHPNSLPFEPRYPSLRVGVAPGYPGEEDTSDSCEIPDGLVDYSNNQQYPVLPTVDNENQLPVSVCVQLPPKTPLKLSKGILQQIIYSLTDGSSACDSVVDPVIPDPIPIPLPTYPVPPVIKPQPPIPPPILPPVLSIPPQPYYVEKPAYTAINSPQPLYTNVGGFIQPGGPLIPVDPIPLTTTPAPVVVVAQTPRYPKYDASVGQQPAPYVSQPKSSCYTCGSSLKPRYNLNR